MGAECDPLVPEYCMLPFPNNFYLTPDNSTATGWILNITPESLPVSDQGEFIDPADWLHRDGFARVMPLSTIFPKGVSLELSNLPRHWDIQQSLKIGGPSVLLDTVTGELLPHWAETDHSTPGASGENQMLMMWPTRALEFGRRYIVAYSQLICNDGEPCTPSSGFVQLRDGISSSDPNIEGRRDHFNSQIFSLLEKAGISRRELQIAWDFTVASESNTRDPLRFMVKDALSRLPAQGPAYVVLSVRDDPGTFTGRHILGRYRVPLYLEDDAPGSKLVFGDDGMPAFQGWTWAPFSVTIPVGITKGGRSSQGVLQYGHGLFQNHLVILTTELQRASDIGNLVLYGTNMVGMSAGDVAAVADMLATDLSDSSILPHGCMQGVVNHHVLTKMIMGDFAKDERVIFNNQSAINLIRHGYLGYSLGGIYGSTILSMSEDIHEGIFGVPGTPFVMLLPRATPFTAYWSIICSRYSDPRDRIAMLSYIQIIWDHVDSVAYADLLASDPRKMGQYIWAKGDTQVTYLGNGILARTANSKTFPNIVTSRANETQFGIEVINGNEAYSGMITMGYEFHIDEITIYNSFSDGFDTHNEVYKQDTFVYRSLSLLLDRVHLQQCEGICSYDP